ncbi:hypothetical protein AB0E21_31330 [Streptomyces sp. NPDC047967]|uniref:hypothetical protein n=1 Tax=unclassified Streptomyces TaxID=2593676 RepID=UPI0033D46BE5
MATVACTLLVAGCSVSVDPGELPGAYRDEETGGEIVLNSDGTFFATGISPDDATGGGGADARDFSGRWEFVDSGANTDRVFLSVEDGGFGEGDLIQLYPSDSLGRLTNGGPTVAFRPDPDGPPSLVLREKAAP